MPSELFPLMILPLTVLPEAPSETTTPTWFGAGPSPVVSRPIQFPLNQIPFGAGAVDDHRTEVPLIIRVLAAVAADDIMIGRRRATDGVAGASGGDDNAIGIVIGGPQSADVIVGNDRITAAGIERQRGAGVVDLQPLHRKSHGLHIQNRIVPVGALALNRHPPQPERSCRQS